MPIKVLTGSTNFSVTGMYVNSNHVLIFNDPKIAALYEESWNNDVKTKPFKKATWATTSFHFPKNNPVIDYAFYPHNADFATQYLNKITDRIKK